MGYFTEGFAVGFNAVQGAKQRRADEEQRNKRNEQIDTQQGLDALGLMTSLREHEEGYSADIDRILAQRGVLASGAQVAGQNLSLAQTMRQPDAINRATLEYSKAIGALNAADAEMGALAQRRSMARRQSEEVSNFLAKRGILTETIGMRDQIQQLQQPPQDAGMGGESFERPAYSSPSVGKKPQGEQQAATMMAPEQQEAPPQASPQEQPNGPSPLEIWQQLAQAENLPTGTPGPNGLEVQVNDPDIAKQLMAKYDALGKGPGRGAAHPFVVNDTSEEEKQSEGYLKERTQTFEGTREKMLAVKQKSALLEKATLPSASDAMVSAAMESIASDEDATPFMKQMAAGAKMASPEERKAVVKAMRELFGGVIKEYEGALAETEPEAKAYRKRGRKKAGVEDGAEADAVAPKSDESLAEFGERYAKSKGWDWSKKLSPAQLAEIKAAHAKGE